MITRSPLSDTLQAIIWDMNGVLLDDELYQWEAFKQVLANRGVLVPEDDFERYCGVTEQECFGMALSISKEDTSVRECMAERRECYKQLMNGALPLYPGAAEAVTYASEAGYAQAIASGACREEVLAVVEALGAHRFKSVVAAENVSRGKPDPEGYLSAASLLGLAPEACIVVEDSVHGIEAALAAGMRCVAVAHTLPAERLSRAHVVMPSLEEAVRAGALGFTPR